jgi:excisionase family DNA binding protein
MTLEEVAQYLRVTEKTIYRLLDKRGIPATRVGHQWRFDRAIIETWLRQSSTETVAHILVIDDDETICSLFKDTLEDAGYKVTAVTDSYEALELLKKWDYDLVFLDLKMPGMDGAELLGQIRATNPEIPVTVVTGYPESDLMMKALDYGPLGVVKKPFKSSDILTTVKNYLRMGITAKQHSINNYLQG